MNHRALEISFGIVTLLSVISVPIPRTAVILSPPPSRMARLDEGRIEALRRESRNQQEEVDRLLSDAQSLSAQLTPVEPALASNTRTSSRHANRAPAAPATEEDIMVEALPSRATRPTARAATAHVPPESFGRSQ